MKAGDTVNVKADGDVALRSDDPMKIDSVSGKNTDIAAIGSLTSAGTGTNVAGSDVKLDAISLNGETADIGTGSQPLNTQASTMSLNGTNANISNTGDLTLENVRTTEDTTVNTKGNLNQKDGTTIKGDDVTLGSTGNTELGDIENRNLTVNAGGNITEKAGSDVTTNNLNLTAGGSITLDNTKASEVNAKSGGSTNLTNTNVANDINVTAGSTNLNGTTAENVNVTTTGDANLTNTKAEKDVTVEAGSDAKLAKTEAGENVSVTTGGDAKLEETKAGKDVTVEAGSNAQVSGTTTNTVSVQADKDVILGNTEAKTGEIISGGKIGQEGGAVVGVDNLTMIASGDIGSDEKPIVINTAEITAIGSNVYLSNLSDLLMIHNITGDIVKIDTKGNINTFRDGMITADELFIHAGGWIGQPDARLRMTVRKRYELLSDIGQIWYENFFWPTLVDKRTGITLYGHFDITAQLKVLTTLEFAQELFPELTAELLKGIATEGINNFLGGCPKDILEMLIERLSEETGANALLWRLIAEGRTLFDFVMKINNPACDSNVSIMIPLIGLNPDYKDELEGQKVYILTSAMGELLCVESKVEDGNVKGVLDELGMSKEHNQYTQVVIISEEEFAKLREEGLIPDEALRTQDGKPVVNPDTVQANAAGTENI